LITRLRGPNALLVKKTRLLDWHLSTVKCVRGGNCNHMERYVVSESMQHVFLGLARSRSRLEYLNTGWPRTTSSFGTPNECISAMHERIVRYEEHMDEELIDLYGQMVGCYVSR
jgi:hypothetical protein